MNLIQTCMEIRRDGVKGPAGLATGTGIWNIRYPKIY